METHAYSTKTYVRVIGRIRQNILIKKEYVKTLDFYVPLNFKKPKYQILLHKLGEGSNRLCSTSSRGPLSP